MRTHENYRGTRHRTLVLMYIIWLTLSLAPAMVTPPERTFQQGQPEMQQAMDNMVTHMNIIQKRTNSFGKEGSDNQDINFKTSNLLEEAEKVLRNLPDLKKRQWIESFVERMKEFMMGKTAQQQNLSKDFESLNGAPVPDGLPKQLTKPATSAVPETNPFQKQMSRIQMTSPEVSRVLPYNDDHPDRQAVTKPVALSSKIEESERDELVRELESLHDEITNQVLSKSAKMVNDAHRVTTLSTPLSSESNHATSVNEVSEKGELKDKLMEEIAEFHRIGGVMPKDVIDVLYADSHKVADPAPSRKINVDDEMIITESGMKDKQGMLRLGDLKNEDRAISMVNMKNVPYYTGQQFQYMKFNDTFQNKHPNMVQAFPKQNGNYFQNIPFINKAELYQVHPQSENQNLQKLNPYNQGKHHDLDMLHSPGYISNALKQKMSKPHIFYNGRWPPANYNNYFMRHSYGPYPYMHSWNPQNSTNRLPQMVTPIANQAKIDTQLSDEMKRELRDGKIIVLSDSVVRSNFKPDNEKGTQKSKSQQMDMKNGTITEN